LPDTKAMPGHIARRLRSIQTEVEQLAPNKDRLSGQLADIERAHQAAETLPLDLQTLADSRDRVLRLADESALSADKAKSSATAADISLNSITSKEEEAAKLVAQCEEAYRITTTKGLAAAFDLRASRLGNSMWVWVFGLMCALSAGTYMGSNRIEVLSRAVSSVDPQWGSIWIQIVLSVLSIGAPVWFAWLSTKQIGQRFRLAEDYAFKASVAKAYEGYRKEAARLDPAFEARLFGSALTRLEEAPLRLVETGTHGSPWHEFFASAPFQDAINGIPELKDAFLNFGKRGISTAQAVLKIKDASTPGLQDRD
jgi:hypothetical protein